MDFRLYAVGVLILTIPLYPLVKRGRAEV